MNDATRYRASDKKELEVDPLAEALIRQDWGRRGRHADAALNKLKLAYHAVR
jgi:hypothetical protein